MTTPALKRESQNLRTEAEVRAQRKVWSALVAQLEMGEIGEVEFTELAMDAGMPIRAIGSHLQAARDA